MDCQGYIRAKRLDLREDTPQQIRPRKACPLKNTVDNYCNKDCALYDSLQDKCEFALLRESVQSLSRYTVGLFLEMRRESDKKDKKHKKHKED